jgi:hypothetical protein
MKPSCYSFSIFLFIMFPSPSRLRRATSPKGRGAFGQDEWYPFIVFAFMILYGGE